MLIIFPVAEIKCAPLAAQRKKGSFGLMPVEVSVLNRQKHSTDVCSGKELSAGSIMGSKYGEKGHRAA